MQITAISPAVKTAGRYNIFVDGQYSFSLDESQVIELGVRRGQELGPEDIKRLQKESEFGKHYMRTLELIARRPRSVWEVEQYARKKQWEPGECKAIITKLLEKRYLNDEDFAKYWVRQRLSSGKKSRRVILAELQAKRVPSSAVMLAESEFPDDADTLSLEVLIAKKSRLYPDRRKLVAYLMSKGYRYSDIESVLSSERFSGLYDARSEDS